MQSFDIAKLLFVFSATVAVNATVAALLKKIFHTALITCFVSPFFKNYTISSTKLYVIICQVTLQVL